MRNGLRSMMRAAGGTLAAGVLVYLYAHPALEPLRPTLIDQPLVDYRRAVDDVVDGPAPDLHRLALVAQRASKDLTYSALGLKR